MIPSITETTDEYYHVRFNDPEKFDTIRTPDWAENAASSVTEGAEVRTGHREGDGESDWEIRSVLVPTGEASAGRDATALAKQIGTQIESGSVRHRLFFGRSTECGQG
jgi:hypothetical protein